MLQKEKIFLLSPYFNNQLEYKYLFLVTFIQFFKVREATNDDPWGPSGQQMQEISSCTFAYEAFPEVMGMLWKRMLHDDRYDFFIIIESEGQSPISK